MKSPLRLGRLVAALLMLAAEHANIKVPGHSARISISEVFAFLIAFHLGPWAAAVALAVDGKCLAILLERRMRAKLLALGINCSAVICCRVSPLQKSQITK